MKATIESTETITSIDDVPCRVWSGLTEQGVPFFVFVHRVAVQVGDGREAQFEEELLGQGEPTTSMHLGLAVHACNELAGRAQAVPT